MSTENEKQMNTDEPELIGDHDTEETKARVDPDGMKMSRNSSLAMMDYFNTIEQMCEEKGIYKDNIDRNFKVHWLRNAIGGSFSRAQEMFGKYTNYLEAVPEEAQAVEVPEPVRIAVCDLMSFVTWYFRMSYSGIQDENVKIAENRCNTLQNENSALLTRLQAAEKQIAGLSDNERHLQAQLTQQQAIASELELSLEDCRSQLTRSTRQYEEAQGEVRLLQQTTGTLNLQLTERKQELSSQLEYQKQLIDENKVQQAEISMLHTRANKLDQTVSDLTASVNEQIKLREVSDNLLVDQREMLARMTSELSDIQSLVKQSTAENKELKDDVETLKEDLAEESTWHKHFSGETEKLKGEIIMLEATLKAEKTIAESLRGTIESLSNAMAGGNAVNAKKPRTKKAS